MNPPRLIFDCHLDIAMNAMEYNRDQRWTQEKIRRSEIGATALVVVVITYLSIVLGELVPKRLGQIRPESIARIVARPVVDFGRRHQLAALLEAGDQHRLAVGACGVDGGAVAGGSGTQDDQPRVAGVAHV